MGDVTMDAHGRTRAVRVAQRQRLLDAAARSVARSSASPECWTGDCGACRREDPDAQPELPAVGCLCPHHDPEETPR